MSRKLLSTYRKWVRNKGIDSYCIQVFNYLDPIFVAPALAWVTKACKFPSVCSSIRPSVCPSVCLSVRQHLPWVSCERNSSYSFLLIFLKLCRCFLHGVRMCMWFGYNCWIIFYHFFHFSHFSTSMYRQWVPCERNSSYNFIPILLKLCTCFLHGLKMYIWFGYNLCIYFCYFFHFANFVIFWPQILWKCCDSEYLVSATPHTIL